MAAESADRAHRRLRREALRRAHPDLGGTAEELDRIVRLLGAPPAGLSRGRTAGDEVRFVHRPRGLARVPAWWRERLRRRRSTVPRRVL